MDETLAGPAVLYRGDEQVAAGELLELLQNAMTWDEASFEKAQILRTDGAALGPREIEAISTEYSIEDM